MKFEVKYPTGAQHEVELSGTVATLGRDPTSDLVLNDAKCSRRHAVVEAGPSGIAIRDAGSANGIFVNGKKVDRAQLTVGDIVRLGEVVLKVLPEDVPGTVVMAPEDVDVVTRPPRPAPGTDETTPEVTVAPELPTPSIPSMRPPPPPPPPPPPRPSPSRPPSGAGRPERLSTGSAPRISPRPMALPRPVTLSLITALWLLGVLLYLLGAVASAAMGGPSAAARWGGAALGLLLAATSGLMAWGLFNRAPWARVLQIGLAGLGLLTCAFTPASAVILFYMLRPETRLQFEQRSLRDLSETEMEMARRPPGDVLFTVGILAALALALVLGMIAALAIPALLAARAAT